MVIQESAEDYLEKVLMLSKQKANVRQTDICDATGYARPSVSVAIRKLASEATADNINTARLKEKARQAQIAAERAEAQETAKKLESVNLIIKAKAGQNGKLFGAVTSQEISEALKEQAGIEIEKNKIVQGDPIKAYGSYQVRAKLGYEISGNVNLTVVEG